MTQPPPAITPEAGRQALVALLSGQNLLGALQAMQARLGDVFQLPLPGFRAVVLAGPHAARFVLAQAAPDLRWRVEGDPVVRLLRHGLLVEDGDAHRRLRQAMTPALHKRMLPGYTSAITASVDDVTAAWQPGEPLDLAAELRRMALLSLTRTLFGVDMAPDLRRLWTPILKSLRYIAPGAWIVWAGAPRPGYARPLRLLDEYLHALISAARAQPAAQGEGRNLLGLLIDAGLPDDDIRDQLLTMLIAGHDTSTALLAWALLHLLRHPAIRQRALAEVDGALAGEAPGWQHLPRLGWLDCVVKETLRLNPPIHTANRIVASDLCFQGYRIPAGTRVLFSIYLTHRHPAFWPEPERFQPERFLPGGPGQPPYAYVPFGGGERVCIGAAFALAEARLILARLLQRFDFDLLNAPRQARMGATLDPWPPPRVKATRRV